MGGLGLVRDAGAVGQRLTRRAVEDHGDDGAERIAVLLREDRVGEREKAERHGADAPPRAARARDEQQRRDDGDGRCRRDQRPDWQDG
jgi:hypothetical protein